MPVYLNTCILPDKLANIYISTSIHTGSILVVEYNSTVYTSSHVYTGLSVSVIVYLYVSILVRLALYISTHLYWSAPGAASLVSLPRIPTLGQLLALDTAASGCFWTRVKLMHYLWTLVTAGH